MVVKVCSHGTSHHFELFNTYQRSWAADSAAKRRVLFVASTITHACEAATRMKSRTEKGRNGSYVYIAHCGSKNGRCSLASKLPEDNWPLRKVHHSALPPPPPPPLISTFASLMQRNERPSYRILQRAVDSLRKESRVPLASKSNLGICMVTPQV